MKLSFKQLYDNLYQYHFTVDKIDLDCYILLKNNKCYVAFEPTFIGEDGIYPRLNKGIKFINEVLNTIIECINDFINKFNINTIILKGSKDNKDKDKISIRTKLYLRLIHNRFPDYRVKRRVNRIEITIPI